MQAVWYWCRSHVGESRRVSRYDKRMARGWESKSVEQQQAENLGPRKTQKALSPEQKAKAGRKQALQLARSQVIQQLQSAHHPRHRQMLEKALADLNERLAQLD